MKKLFMILLLVLLLCFTFGCQKQKEELAAGKSHKERLPIIDVHVHAYPTLQGEWMPKDLYIPETDEELMYETFKRLQRFNVVKAVMFGDALDKWKEKSPITIIPGWQNGIAGNRQEDIDSLRSNITNGQIEVIGEIEAQYMGLAPNDSSLEPYYSMAEELDVPVGIHVGPGPPGYSPLYHMRNGKPLLLEDVLVKHPKLRIYVMHAGWPFLDEMVALLYFYPQVYVDIGGSWLIPRDEFHFYLRRLVQAGFGKRILFGSDQMVWPDAIELAIETVEAADFLTEEQKRDIFYNNAARFFRFEE